MLNKPMYKTHPDCEGVDGIRIRLVERYKTSGLSGDEWRFSAVLEMFFKGEVVFEKWFTSLTSAVSALPWYWRLGGEAEEFDFEAKLRGLELCCQPGCSNEPVSEYRLKKEWSKDCCFEKNPTFDYRRRFCQKHLKRGDCGLDDTDSNYEVVSGPGPDANDWDAANITESAQVVVNCESPDQIGEVINQTLKDKAWDTNRN